MSTTLTRVASTAGEGDAPPAPIPPKRYMVRTPPLNLPLRCRCGYVRGIAREVSSARGFRFVCYCKDCQAFARILGRPDVLDSAGGTDIFQMPPSRVEVTAGADALCRLSLSGKVLRWYADCCRTPIANTAAGPRFPVVALIHSFMDQTPHSPSLDALLGPPLCRIYERSAIGPLPMNAAPPPSFRVSTNRATKILGWWVRGLGQPNPFFDGRTNAPRCVPHVPTSSHHQ